MDPEARVAVGERTGPLHRLITAGILSDIRGGRLPAGEPIPSPRRICERYDCSSTTARRVLFELHRAGIAERRVGIGTFVAPTALLKRIALVVMDHAHALPIVSAHCGELLGGVGEASWRHHCQVTVAYPRNRSELAAWLGDVRRHDLADGMVVRASGGLDHEESTLLEATGLPVVVVKRHLTGGGLFGVVVDERASARLAVEHLCELGHRRVGFVSAQPESYVCRERLAGYRAALGARGIPYAGALVRLGKAFAPQEGCHAVADLWRAERPTAIVIASVDMALGAYTAAREAGLAIQQDLSLAAVDDIPQATELHPPLTTVSTAHADLGRAAVERLVDVIDARWQGRAPAPCSRVLPPLLRLRGSSAPPAGP